MVILGIFLTSFFAAISPGPNLYFVISQTNVSKKNGFLSAFGVIIGVLFWLLLLSFGFEFFLKKSAIITGLNFLSAIYLGYLGIHCILKKDFSIKEDKVGYFHGDLKTFFKSMLLALFNVEIAAFYSAIFTNIASQKHEIISKLSFLANSTNNDNYLILFFFFSICFLIIESFVFFSSVFVFSFFDILKRNAKRINRILGIFITYYALSILFEVIKKL